MALKYYKPTTPGQRQLVLVDRSELHKGAPVKALTEGLSKTGGRNNLGRITALCGDGFTQAGQIHQCGLAEDVVADHPRREPREVDVALAFDQLPEECVASRWIGAAHDVFGMHPRRIRQACPRTGLERFNRFPRIEKIQGRVGQGLAVGCA